MGGRPGGKGVGANEQLTKAGAQEILWEANGTRNRGLSVSSKVVKSHRGTKE